MDTPKKINPTDRLVGGRVRMRRLILKMSQEKLGDALGLTFQQVQKYEKGANRIGASRLQQIATILQVPVSFFFEGVAEGDTEVQRGNAKSMLDITECAMSRDGIRLLSAFMLIADAQGRKCVIEVAERIAGAPPLPKDH